MKILTFSKGAPQSNPENMKKNPGAALTVHYH